MSHILATTQVPPRSSMSLFASSGDEFLDNLSMPHTVGVSINNCNTQTEKKWWDRLNYVFSLSGMNQSRLAEAVGVAYPTVHDWLHGNVKMIAGDNLVRVCQVLRINPLWLITGQGLALVQNRRVGERRGKDRRNDA